MKSWRKETLTVLVRRVSLENTVNKVSGIIKLLVNHLLPFKMTIVAYICSGN